MAVATATAVIAGSCLYGRMQDTRLAPMTDVSFLGVRTTLTGFSSQIEADMQTIGVKQVSSNYHGFAVVLNDGTVRSWGNSDFGSLTSNPYPSYPVISSMSDIVVIGAAGQGFAAATSGGEFRTWGRHPVTAVPPTTRSPPPVAIEGTWAGCFAALYADGTIQGFGQHTYCRPSQAVVDGLAADGGCQTMTSNDIIFACVTPSGTAYSWGHPSYLIPTSILSAKPVKQVALQVIGAIVLYTDGTTAVHRWSGSSASAPGPVAEIMCERMACIGVMEDGRVWAWGNGAFGSVNSYGNNWLALGGIRRASVSCGVSPGCLFAVVGNNDQLVVMGTGGSTTGISDVRPARQGFVVERTDGSLYTIGIAGTLPPSASAANMARAPGTRLGVWYTHYSSNNFIVAGFKAGVPPGPSCSAAQQGGLDFVAGLGGAVSLADGLSGGAGRIVESAVVSAADASIARDVSQACITCAAFPRGGSPTATSAKYCKSSGFAPSAAREVNATTEDGRLHVDVAGEPVCVEEYAFAIESSLLATCVTSALSARPEADGASTSTCDDVTVRVTGEATTSYPAGTARAPASHTAALDGVDIEMQECATTVTDAGTLTVNVRPPFDNATDIECFAVRSELEACTGRLSMVVTCDITSQYNESFFFEAGADQTSSPAATSSSATITPSVSWQADAGLSTTFTLIANDNTGAASGAVVDLSGIYTARILIGCTEVSCGAAYESEPYTIEVSAVSMAGACPSFELVQRATHTVASSAEEQGGFGLPRGFDLAFDVTNRFSGQRTDAFTVTGVSATFTQTKDVTGADVATPHTATVDLGASSSSFAFSTTADASTLTVTVPASVESDAELTANPGEYDLVLTVTTSLPLATAAAEADVDAGALPGGFAEARRRLQSGGFASELATSYSVGSISASAASSSASSSPSSGSAAPGTSTWALVGAGVGAALVVGAVAAVAVVRRRRSQAEARKVQPSSVVPAA